MQLNQYGKIVHAHLEKLPMYYDYLVLDDYVVMPNHIHILVLINKTELDVLNKDILSKDVSEKHLYGVDDYENQNKNYYSRISAKKGSL
jgi:REP element-mobilizing transposase RayT